MGGGGEADRRDHRLKPRLFLAGASGAIGRRLVPLLVAEGYEVWGTTRFAARAGLLREMGAIALVVDVFDEPSLARAVMEAKPQAILHQLTDLPPGLDPARMAEALGRNARIRIEGTAQGVAALEQQTLHSPPLEGLVRRYGRLYGPGTGKDDPPPELPCHVDVAARAALAAVETGEPGIVRVVDADPYLRLSSATK